MHVQATDPTVPVTAPPAEQPPTSTKLPATGQLQRFTVRALDKQDNPLANHPDKEGYWQAFSIRESDDSEGPLAESSDQPVDMGRIHPKFLVYIPKKVEPDTDDAGDAANKKFAKVLFFSMAVLVALNVMAAVVEAYFFYQQHQRLPRLDESFLARIGE